MLDHRPPVPGRGASQLIPGTRGQRLIYVSEGNGLCLRQDRGTSPHSLLQTFLFSLLLLWFLMFSELILQVEQVSKPCRGTCAAQDRHLIIELPLPITSVSDLECFPRKSPQNLGFEITRQILSRGSLASAVLSSQLVYWKVVVHVLAS